MNKRTLEALPLKNVKKSLIVECEYKTRVEAGLQEPIKVKYSVYSENSEVKSNKSLHN